MGGKGGAQQVAQPAPSPYETQLAAMSKDLYESTDPLRDTYISQWMNFLNPTQTLKPGAVPTYASSYSSGTPSGYIDPLTGQLYGANPPGLQTLPGSPAREATPGYPFPFMGAKDAQPATETSYQILRDGFAPLTVTPYGGMTGGSQSQGSPIYQPSDYVTSQFNPASLPGYTPQYDISRRGLEAQYNTAMGNAVATTPRGGAMSDALNKLNLARAESVGGLPNQISSGLISDMLNKSYGAAFNTPAQSISGLGAANQSYTSTQNAMIQAQTAANAQSAQSKGGLGGGLGTVVGSVLGSGGLGGLFGGGASAMTAAESLPLFMSMGAMSDKRTKENIRALDVVNKLNPVLFDYRPEYGHTGQIGFIADEIEKIAPGMVIIGEDGLKRILPYAFIPLLVNAIKEQQAVIDELKSRS